MDLVIKTKSEGWWVLDYKTNRMAAGDKETLAREYEIQLLLYAFVFKKLYGEAPKKGVLYFSSIHEAFEFSYGGNRLEAFGAELQGYFKKAMEVKEN